ncbi:alpha/beta fold hydrolase [Deinococcus maricopensis]|uniref:Alpha/beta hydrolase fold protein n=1 Tax=Deinococcus maricopensis (strain DSM 21211 / LMG 22137 / NRRL B-23946 / LB-34) TaxID=709986 RepID=E8U6T2_DEIML|nr:alpha/beta hydrolase [Deinococcus maricopensis]ADV66771.1 alpha/beta hydrolase fold protein [Deinococcus maricopensis DSM 21211]
MHVNGLHLHVHEAGRGEPLVLLHGLGSNVTALAPDIEHFARTHRVIALDSRGHGRSDRPAHYTLQDHIDDVVGVLDALHLDRVALMGSSMGSYVAQGVATQHPHRVGRLMLVTPKAHGQTSSSARFLAAHAAELAGRTPEQISAFLLDHLFAPTTPASVREAARAFAAEQARAGLTLTPEQQLAANRALEGFDFRAALPRVTARTLVLSGRHDPLNTVADGEEVARLIPNATFMVLERAGHLPALEDAAHLHTLVDAFLAGREGA